MFVGKIISVHNDALYNRQPGWPSENFFRSDDDEKIESEMLATIKALFYGCETGEISSLVITLVETDDDASKSI